MLNNLVFNFRILGKNRQVRLYPLSSLDGHDTEPVKIVETKGTVYRLLPLREKYTSNKRF